jgi:hypothetical protein
LRLIKFDVSTGATLRQNLRFRQVLRAGEYARASRRAGSTRDSVVISCSPQCW